MNNYFEYEEISLTVVKRINKKKVFGLLLILLILILLVILLYLSIVNHKMTEIAGENGMINSEDKGSANIETEYADNTNKLPKLSEQGRKNMENIYVSNEKRVYITFDDGPSRTVTPQILNILEQYDIRATFFVLGCNVERYPDLVKQEYETGHYIANHGYSHNYDGIYSSAQSVLDEFVRTDEAIRSAIGVKEYYSHLFRFPGGSMGKKYRNVKDEAKQLLSYNDVLYIDWNALTNDSVGKPTEESIMRDLVSTVGTKSSVVILMHDAASKQLTATMLPQVLNYLIEQGYKFKTFYDVMV